MPPAEPRIMTVRGPVAPTALGPTLIHEHVMVEENARWVLPLG